jgi:hypothetical protein
MCYVYIRVCIFVYYKELIIDTKKSLDQHTGNPENQWYGSILKVCMLKSKEVLMPQLESESRKEPRGNQARGVPSY